MALGLLFSINVCISTKPCPLGKTRWDSLVTGSITSLPALNFSFAIVSNHSRSASRGFHLRIGVKAWMTLTNNVPHECEDFQTICDTTYISLSRTFPIEFQYTTSGVKKPHSATRLNVLSLKTECDYSRVKFCTYLFCTKLSYRLKLW